MAQSRLVLALLATSVSLLILVDVTAIEGCGRPVGRRIGG